MTSSACQRVPDGVLGHHLLRARVRRLLPGIQQLHPGRSAQDALAHRAGLVFHALLLDAACHHHRDDVRPDRPPGPGRSLFVLLRTRLSVVGQGSPAPRDGRLPVDVQRLGFTVSACCRHRRQVLGRGRHGRLRSSSCSSCPGWTTARSSRSATVRAGTSAVYGCLRGQLRRAGLPGRAAAVADRASASRRSVPCSISASSC